MQPHPPNFRIPALDGLRAVAILLVIFSHVLQTYHWTQEVPFVWRLNPGATGVSLFFVISGYLITTLLLRERATRGHIGLRGFYFRRFFRIVPTYLTYVGTVGLLALAGLTNVPWDDFVRALLYLTNYVLAHWLLAHTWSLSVEEQFYLLFPLLLVFAKRQWVVPVLVITLGVSIAARGLNQLWGLWPIDATYSFEGRADQLAFGCLLALFQQGASSQLQDQLARIALPLAALLLCLGVALPMGPMRVLFFNTLIGLSAALLLHACTKSPQLWLNKILAFSPLRAIGLISYSLYLWQQIWLAPEMHFSLPVALLGALCSGVASYWLIEKTGLRVRDRIASNHPHLLTH